MTNLLNATLANAILSTVTADEIEHVLSGIPESGPLNVISLTEAEAESLLLEYEDVETLWA
jgi:hypothetical protein